MTEPAPSSETSSESTSPAPSAPSSRSEPAKNEGTSQVTLATYLPHVFSLGDNTITPEGTSVPESEADEIRETAAAYGVHVYEVES